MDLLRGFALATVAALGAIALKKVSTGHGSRERDFGFQQDTILSLIPRQEWLLDPRRSRAYPLGGATAAGRSPGSVLYHRSVVFIMLSARFLPKMFIKNRITERD
jgi:hypothetical protein